MSIWNTKNVLNAKAGRIDVPLATLVVIFFKQRLVIARGFTFVRLRLFFILYEVTNIIFQPRKSYGSLISGRWTRKQISSAEFLPNHQSETLQYRDRPHAEMDRRYPTRFTTNALKHGKLFGEKKWLRNQG